MELKEVYEKYVDIQKSELVTQTEDFGMVQLEMMRQELLNQNMQLQI